MFIRVHTFKLVVYILKLSTGFYVFRFYTKKGEVKEDRPSWLCADFFYPNHGKTTG